VLTVNVNGLGAVSLTDQFGNLFPSGAVISGGQYKIVFDGTNFRVQEGGGNSSGFWAGPISGVANAYTVAVSDFVLIAGTRITGIIQAAIGNTGASTLVVNGGPAIPIIDFYGNPLLFSAIQANQFVTFIYDGSNYRIQAIYNNIKGSNMFRNAGFLIQLRGDSGTIVAGTPAYTVDGWMVSSTGGNVNWSTGYGGATGVGQSIELQQATGSVSACSLKQRVESIITAGLPQSGYFTVQWSIDNVGPGTFTPTLTVNSPNTEDSYGGGVANVLGPVNLQPCPLGVTTVSYTFQAGDGYLLNGLELVLNFGNRLETNRVYVSSPDFSNTPNLQNVGIQNMPPAPEIRLAPQEAAFNYRYLQAWTATAANEVMIQGFAIENSEATITMPLLAAMRSIPTVSYSAVSDWRIVYSSVGAIVAATIFFYSASLTQFILGVEVGSGVLTGFAPCFLQSVSSSSQILLSAEL
jgi:hypothetical protein